MRRCRDKPVSHAVEVKLIGTPLGRSWFGQCRCGEYVYASSEGEAWAWMRGIGCTHNRPVGRENEA